MTVHHWLPTAEFRPPGRRSRARTRQPGEPDTPLDQDLPPTPWRLYFGMLESRRTFGKNLRLPLLLLALLALIPSLAGATVAPAAFATPALLALASSAPGLS